MDLPVRHSAQPMVVIKDQDRLPAPHFLAPTVDGPSSDALPEASIANKSSLPPLHRNLTPSPRAPLFETSLSFGRIDCFLEDICESFYTLGPHCRAQLRSDLSPPVVETPVHRFSRPAPTFGAHDAGDLTPSSSFNGLGIAEDLS